MQTEMGKIADAIAQAEDELTPLQIKLNELSGILTKLVVGICAIVFVVGIFQHGGMAFFQDMNQVLNTFMVAVSLALCTVINPLSVVVHMVPFALGLLTAFIVKRYGRTEIR
jgi:Ca2+-transporting ATPase